jgi:LuxR family transcriptional activator of conjugal transfer of Ti plasmids
MREISKIEGMKYSTVRFHLAEAKSKLNVFSLRKAITLAMTLKLI